MNPHMSQEMGRAAFRIALFLVMLSAILLFVLSPGSAEFVLTVITLALGSLFMLALWFLLRRFSQ